MNLCIGLYRAYESLDVTVAMQRIGTHDVETPFGVIRSGLVGHCQFRFWETLGRTQIDGRVSRCPGLEVASAGWARP
jgi:hypothetical protein